MNQLLHYISILVSIWLARPAGQEVKPFSMQEFSNQSDTASAIIPFTRAGNLILIKGKVDSIEGNFILDTGAPHLVLNVTYFRDYPVEHIQDAEQTSINGSSYGVMKTRVKNFEFATFEYKNLDADLASLGHIENSKGVRILGLLGLELFTQCEMIIDYQEELLYLKRLPKRKSDDFVHVMMKEKDAYHTIPFDLLDNRIMVNTVMNGKKLKFIVDCAAESNVLDSRLPDKVLDFVTIRKRVVLTGSNNKKVDALFGDLEHLKIGKQELGKLPVLITNLENSCFSYAGCVDGVLGFDFLSLQKVGFNFVKRKMYIWK